MKTAATLAAVPLLVATAAIAGAQTKVVPGTTERITVTVEAIDHANRQVTVKKSDGTYEAIYVPASIKAFDTLKIGDRVTSTHYQNMVLQLKKPGEKAVDTASGGVVKAPGPGGTASRQRTITATVAAIDEKAPSITFTGPNGWKYSTRVEDRKALAQVKVGDRVDITWTEATVLSLEAAK
jgi:hypothetical protein